MAGLCLAAAACAGSSTDSNPFAKAGDLFSKPDWVAFSGSRNTASKVVMAEDLIGADGSCAGSPIVPSAPDAGSAPEGTVGANPREPNAMAAAGAPVEIVSAPANDSLLPMTSGVALGMSECEVARRAGAPERVEVGADDRGERAVVLTYMRGERAGIYRFREGRLFTIERVQVAEPEKPKKPAKTAKPAAKKPPKQQAAKPASAPGNAAPWPAQPQQKQAPAQAAPWPAQPAPQHRAAQQSQVWPSPPPLRSANP